MPAPGAVGGSAGSVRVAPPACRRSRGLSLLRPAPRPPPDRPTRSCCPALPLTSNPGTRWRCSATGVRARASGGEDGARGSGPSALEAVARGAEAGAGAGGAGWPALWRPSRYDGEIWAISIPILCASLLVPLSAAVDTAIVGRLGSAQLGGVGLASVFTTILTAMFVFLPILTTPAVAKAAAHDDPEELSKTIANSIWVATIIGTVISVCSFHGADALIALLKPTQGVRQYAALYIKCLSFFGPVSLLFQTLAGVFRGLKDTKALFWGSACSASTNVILDVLFVFGFHWGVVGAGAATVLSVWVGALFLLGKLLKRGILLPKDATSPPSATSFLLKLRNGAPLSIRSLISLGMVFYTSVAVSRLNVTVVAAFEIMRQVFLLAYLSYTPLEYTTQALCASYLGKGDVVNAQRVFRRLLQLALMISTSVGLLFVLNRAHVGRVFTTDMAVVAQFLTVAPLVFAVLPLDAAAAIMDGALVASQNANYVAFAHIASSLVGLCVVMTVINTGNLNLLTSWLCIKLGFLGRSLFTGHKLFLSKDDPFTSEEKAAGLQADVRS